MKTSRILSCWNVGWPIGSAVLLAAGVARARRPGFRGLQHQGRRSIAGADGASQGEEPATWASSRCPTTEDDAKRAAAPTARIASAAAAVQRAEKALAAITKRRDKLVGERDRLASKLVQIDGELTAMQADVDDLAAELDAAAAELKLPATHRPTDVRSRPVGGGMPPANFGAEGIDPASAG